MHNYIRFKGGVLQEATIGEQKYWKALPSMKRRLMNKNNSRRALLIHGINKQAINIFSEYLNPKDDSALFYDTI